MKHTLAFFLPPALALLGLILCCLLLWNQTARFRTSVEAIAEDVRVSLIGTDGKVTYDSAGHDLPNHAARAEIEAVLADGKARNVIRESETLHTTMFYHARKVGDSVLRIAVPYHAVTEARAYAKRGLLAAIGIGALIVLALFFFTRQYERRLARLAAERDVQEKLLDEMRKLESFRRDFIANVSHEVKTPVTGILGAVEVLADIAAKLDADDREELHAVLKDQSVRLNALLEDILSLSNLEAAEAHHAVELAPCNVIEIVQTAVNLALPQAHKANIDLVFEPITEVTSLIRPCDPRLIESAVTNLIQNALRHSKSPLVEVSVHPGADGKATVKVVDHGIGIPAECLCRLFERFYRVDKALSRALGGTGLGLAIVKHIAQLHGGTVSVDAAPGRGATFALSF